jgi:alginate O-acetyltransferase complex protein AlgI
LITSLAWVFFRASDLSRAVSYLQNMLGLGQESESMHLVSGVIYQPWYLCCMGVAVLITWTAPQTWDFTRRLSWPKIVWIAAMLLLSIAVMTMQSFNPFIYFIF